MLLVSPVKCLAGGGFAQNRAEGTGGYLGNQGRLAALQKFCYTENMETVVRISERGTLTLPKEFRRKLGLECGGQVIIDDAGEGIRIRPGVTLPIEIYTDERLKEFAEEEAKLLGYRF